jgi:hypothetical protein
MLALVWKIYLLFKLKDTAMILVIVIGHLRVHTQVMQVTLALTALLMRL